MITRLGRIIMRNKLYTAEFGIKLLTVLMKADISGYTAIQYAVKKPSGTEVTFPLTVEYDGSGEAEDARVFYYTEVDDLDEVGTYSFQVELIFANAKYLSDTVKVPVYESFE